MIFVMFPTKYSSQNYIKFKFRHPRRRMLVALPLRTLTINRIEFFLSNPLQHWYRVWYILNPQKTSRLVSHSLSHGPYHVTFCVNFLPTNRTDLFNTGFSLFSIFFIFKVKLSRLHNDNENQSVDRAVFILYILDTFINQV